MHKQQILLSRLIRFAIGIPGVFLISLANIIQNTINNMCGASALIKKRRVGLILLLENLF